MDEHLQNNVDKLFMDSLQHFKNDPSEEVWEKIENELNKDDRKIVTLQNRRKAWITISLFIILTGFGIITTLQLKKDKSFISKSFPRNPNSIITDKEHANNNTKSNSADVLTQDDKLIGIPNNAMWSKNLNFGNRNISTLIKYKPFSFIENSDSSLINESGKRNIPIISDQEVKSKFKSLHIDPRKLHADQGMNDKFIVKQERQSFKDRFSIIPYFSQEFAGYNFTDNDSTGLNGKEIEQRERNVFSASIGVYINYTFKKRWVLQSGISYSWSSSNIDSSTCYAVNDNTGNVQFKLNTISGYGYLQPSSLVQTNVGDSVSTAKTYSQLHYLTVPLILSYNFQLKRFSLLVGGGITFNMLTSATIETKTYGSGNPEKEYTVNMLGLKKVNYGILIKADLEYHINSMIGIDLIPCFKNTLSPINLQTAVSAYPYNFGIGIGMNYRF
ncbi:MAG TPA: outer membrane beta-barrel protein [Puia sp.]